MEPVTREIGPDAVIDVRDDSRSSGREPVGPALQRYLPEFVVLFSSAGRVLGGFNVPADLGELGAVRGPHLAEFVHPQDVAVLLGVAAQALHHSGVEQHVSVRFRGREGGYVATDATVIDARGDADLRGLVLRARPRRDAVDVRYGPGDPTEAAHLIDGRASRFVALAEALPLGIMAADGFGTVVYVNSATEHLLARDALDLMGEGWERAVHPEDRPALVDAVALVLDTGARQHVQFRVADDERRWIAALLVALGDPNRPTGWLATIDDVTDRREAQLQLAHQATHDPLTRLPNRVLLEDRLRHAGNRLARDPSQGVVAVLFVDLDDFKAVNDTYGHAAGDEVLAEVGRRLAETVRATDTVARFGGDEFVTVCEAIPPSEIGVLVDRLLRALRRPIALGDTAVSLDATIGVATTDVALDDMTDLLRRADAEMYRIKKRR